MEPREYLKIYREPLEGAERPEADAEHRLAARLAREIPASHYYCPPVGYRSYHGLSLELLTPDELVELLQDAGLVGEAVPSAAELKTAVEELQRRRQEMEQQAAERDRVMGEQQAQLERIRSSPLWLAYRAAVLPLRWLRHRLRRTRA